MRGIRTAKTTEGVTFSGREEKRLMRGAGRDDAPLSIEAEACAISDCKDGGSFV